MWNRGSVDGEGLVLLFTDRDGAQIRNVCASMVLRLLPSTRCFLMLGMLVVAKHSSSHPTLRTVHLLGV